MTRFTSRFTGRFSVRVTGRFARGLLGTMAMLSAALSAGCLHPPQTEPSQLRTGSPPDIEVLRTSLLLPVGLPDPAAAEVLDRFAPRFGDRVWVAGGTAADRASTLAALHARLPAGIAAEQPPPTDGPLRLVLERTAVRAPVCGNFSAPSTWHLGTGAGPGFGCANTANLHGQVADPADLHHGRSDGRSATERQVLAVENDRLGPTAVTADDASAAADSASDTF